LGGAAGQIFFDRRFNPADKFSRPFLACRTFLKQFLHLLENVWIGSAHWSIEHGPVQNEPVSVAAEFYRAFVETLVYFLVLPLIIGEFGLFHCRNVPCGKSDKRGSACKLLVDQKSQYPWIRKAGVHTHFTNVRLGLFQPGFNQCASDIVVSDAASEAIQTCGRRKHCERINSAGCETLSRCDKQADEFVSGKINSPLNDRGSLRKCNGAVVTKQIP